MKKLLSGKNKYLDRLLEDSHLRLLTASAVGGGWNMLYALYHLVLAIVFRSYWFLTMGVYYLTVCGMRASALRLKKDTMDGPAGRKALRRNGLLTFALAIVFSGVVCLTIMEKRNQNYHTIVAISMAAYTFYCVVLAVRNLVLLKKDRTVQKILLRNCSMVSALGALFGLERMMLGTFGTEAEHFTLVMEAASGAGIFLIIVLFGIHLICLSANRKGMSL